MLWASQCYAICDWKRKLIFPPPVQTALSASSAPALSSYHMERHGVLNSNIFFTIAIDSVLPSFGSSFEQVYLGSVALVSLEKVSCTLSAGI